MGSFQRPLDRPRQREESRGLIPHPGQVGGRNAVVDDLKKAPVAAGFANLAGHPGDFGGVGDAGHAAKINHRHAVAGGGAFGHRRVVGIKRRHRQSPFISSQPKT